MDSLHNNNKSAELRFIEFLESINVLPLINQLNRKKSSTNKELLINWFDFIHPNKHSSNYLSLSLPLPPVQRLVDIKNRPRIPIPDEDPYSVAGNGGGSGGSSGSSGFGNGNAIIASPAMLNGNGALLNGNGVAATREQLLMQAQQQLGGGGGGGRRSEKPPKLPPRDNMYPHDIPKVNIWTEFESLVFDGRW